MRVKVRPPLVDEITFLVHDCNTNAMTLIVQALAAGFPTLDIDEETRW